MAVKLPVAGMALGGIPSAWPRAPPPIIYARCELSMRIIESKACRYYLRHITSVEWSDVWHGPLNGKLVGMILILRRPILLTSDRHRARRQRLTSQVADTLRYCAFRRYRPASHGVDDTADLPRSALGHHHRQLAVSVSFRATIGWPTRIDSSHRAEMARRAAPFISEQTRNVRQRYGDARIRRAISDAI